MEEKRFIRRTAKKFGPAMPFKCLRCKNDVFMNLVRIRKWFVILIYPIPFYSKYFLVCNTCGWRVRLTNRGQIEAAKQLNLLTLSFNKGEITKEDYLGKIQAMHPEQFLPAHPDPELTKLAA